MADKSKGFEWAYRDLLTALMVVFMALGLLAVIASQKIKTIEGVQPGQMFIQMTWKNGSTSDIDLWVLSPDDKPVGYLRSAGKNCDLLRDDLGAEMDITSHAIEMAVCRDPPPGEYIVNTHFYNLHLPNAGDHYIEEKAKEVPMQVEVKILRTMPKDPHTQGSPSTHLKLLFDKTVTLESPGEEITVVRFSLDDKGNVIPGSVNDLPHKIRLSPGEG